MSQAQQPPLTEHQIEVDLLSQAFPELQGELVDVGGLVPEVVGPDDLGVAPGVAASDVALLQHGDAADPMLLDQVVGGGEAVAATPHDDHVVLGLRVRTPPGALPVLVIAEGVPGQAEEGVLLHREAQIIAAGGESPTWHRDRGCAHRTRRDVGAPLVCGCPLSPVTDRPREGDHTWVAPTRASPIFGGNS